MAVLDIVQHAAQFPAYPFVEPEAEHLRDLVCGQIEQTDFTGTLEELVNREVPPKDEIAAVLDLLDRVVAVEVDGLAVMAGKLRSDDPRPVVQALANDRGAEPIGDRLESTVIGDQDERSYAADLGIVVQDPAALDRQLQAVWSDMKQGLLEGDVERSVANIIQSRRNDYRQVLSKLVADGGDVPSVFGDIALVDVVGTRAEYQMIRVDDGVRHSYLVLFVIDDDGVWRLRFF